MESCSCDVAVIGAGPGGYKCAIKAAKLGLSVVCIDENAVLGGTCLRVGCIPSKALLDYSYKYHAAKDLFPKFGVVSQSVTFDIENMFQTRDREIGLLGSGIETMFSAAGVKLLRGTAKVLGTQDDGFDISVSSKDGVCSKLRASRIVLATGSLPTVPQGLEIDERDILSSEGALAMKDVPGRLLVIGGGAIGLEMSSVWSRLGSEVTVVEYSARIASAFDSEVSKTLLNSLKKQGISFNLAQKVVSISKCASGLAVVCESLDDGAVSRLEADKVLVAVGRKPNVAGIVAMEGLRLDNEGFVVVDAKYETSIRGIFAIGDVIGGAMLAHKAEIEGHAVAGYLGGSSSFNVDYGVIPSVIYTHPAAAFVGKAEDSVKSSGYAYKVGKSSFSANGRARITGEGEGFVKVVSCKKTDVILGVHIVGACADTMVNEAAVALGFRATSRDICHICHSHPDVNEAFRDACEVASFSS